MNNFTSADTFGLAVQADLPNTIVQKEGEKEKTTATPLKLTFDFAVQRKVNPNSSVQAKVNFTPQLGDVSKDVKLKPSGIRLGLGSTHFINSNVSATVAADINVSSFLGVSGHAPSSLGFELKLK